MSSLKEAQTTQPNKANVLHEYVLAHWPALVNIPGVWVVGSTAYRIANGQEPNSDLDLICDTKDKVDLVAGTLDINSLSRANTYLGGTRVTANKTSADIWSLKEGQTIDDAVMAFGSNSCNVYNHARVHYAIKDRKLTVYYNDLVGTSQSEEPF